ncbi:hypothetical protein GIB67_041889 [Kingdonia uniflora]|uniref:Uncharacterized protein n=1 Tax=Kingdonia uniflora TaxID=39325 RepID=A0A7J7L5V8_9MAGN|nr:hypothetical protein GIB67_041889 [Kingdonia uniflora]
MEKLGKDHNKEMLTTYGTDLTKMARQGKLNPVIGRQEQIDRVVQILCRLSKNNPCLIGDPGVGKSAIAEGLAQCIVNKEVPSTLQNTKLYSIDMARLVAGTLDRGDFEERLVKLIDEVKQSNGSIILFIDEVHTIVGAGNASGKNDAANILKPALARGEIKCMAATTHKEYKMYIEKDPALERRFHKEYKINRFLPDKAIDLIDEAGSFEKVSGKNVERLLKMEKTLRKRVIGQEEAVNAVSRAIRRARIGIRDPNQPIATFLFTGPSGVGKTELANVLAAEYFGSKEAMLRLDMSECYDKHTIAKLIGSPPGYIGSEEGGQLTEAIRRKPLSLILFDEIEKARKDVFNVMLQIMDDGRLTDGKGRIVDFKNTIIILTSNASSSMIGEAEKVAVELKKVFRAEFLNRLDEVVIFNELTKLQVRKILDVMLKDVIERLEAHMIKMVLTERFKDKVADDGYSPSYGAPPLKRTISRLLEDNLANKILNREINEGDQVKVDVDSDGNVTVNYKPSYSIYLKGIKM